MVAQGHALSKVSLVLAVDGAPPHAQAAMKALDRPACSQSAGSTGLPTVPRQLDSEVAHAIGWHRRGGMMAQESTSRLGNARVPTVAIRSDCLAATGCGKSTMGALLVGRLTWEFEDAVPTAANADKTHNSIPLKNRRKNWPARSNSQRWPVP
jgi:hypothetical protein